MVNQGRVFHRTNVTICEALVTWMVASFLLIDLLVPVGVIAVFTLVGVALGLGARRRRVRVKVQRMSAAARIPGYAYLDDSGADLHVVLTEPRLLPAGGRAILPFGIALELPRGYEAQVRPRSGLTARGILVVLGTVDEGYRGEVGVVVLNTSAEDFTITPGDRIAQLVIAPSTRAEFVQVDKVRPTSRGARGWGSSGV